MAAKTSGITPSFAVSSRTSRACSTWAPAACRFRWSTPPSRRVRYPGQGQRGSAFSSRAAGYGAFGGAPHTQRSNDGIALIVMLETPQAVANAGAIAAVDGVDALFVGPNDLSHTMGPGSDWACAPVQAAMESAIRAAVAAGKCAGTLALTPQDAAKVAGWGANYLLNVSTSIFTMALRDAARPGGHRAAEFAY